MRAWLAGVVRALAWMCGLTGPDGAPSFSKIITGLVVLVVLASVWHTQSQPSAGTVTLLVACIAASFGRSVFLAWLQRTSFVVSELDTDDGRGP